jgi:ribosomal protein L39E
MVPAFARRLIRMPPAPDLSKKILIERIVFGSLIALGLFIFCGLLVPAIHGHWRTRDKTRVLAKLDQVEMAGRRAKHREVVVSYDYEVAGQRFTGDRVSLWAKTAQFYPVLASAKRENRRVPVFIDPDDPSYAVYHRDFRMWPMTGALLFSIVPVGMGIHGLRWRAKQPRT